MAVGRERLGPALYLGGGLALVGAAGYAFVALTGHTLPPADAAAAASVYLMVNIIGPGLFSALEQETSRSVSAEIAAGRDPGRVTRNAALLAAATLAGVVVLLLALSPVLTGKALGGRWGLFAAVLLSVVTSAAVYLVRGLVGGRQRFTGYAATLGAEGVARILPCVVLALSGVADVVAYAVAFAAGSAFGALAGLPWLRAPIEPRPLAAGVTVIGDASAPVIPLSAAASGVTAAAPTGRSDGPGGSSRSDELGGLRGPSGPTGPSGLAGPGRSGAPDGPREPHRLSGSNGLGGPGKAQGLGGLRGPGGSGGAQGSSGSGGPDEPGEAHGLSGSHGLGGSGEAQGFRGSHGLGGPGEARGFRGASGPGGPGEAHGLSGLRGPGGSGEAAPSVGRMARGLSFLAGGTVLMLLVANLAPIVVTPRLAADAATAAAFASAFVLARVPLFLFAPVQAVLLPALTRAATRGELDRVRATLRRILLAVAAVGIPGVVASYLVGPWAVQVLFGADVRLPAGVVGLLGVSTVGLMVGQVLQPGLVALGRHQVVTFAWLAGAVVLVTVLALPGDALRAGVAGQLGSAAVVVVVMLGALHRDLGKHARPR